MNKAEAVAYLRRFADKKFKSVWNQRWASNVHEAVYTLCKDFEYPDWDYRTIDDFLRRFGKNLWSVRLTRDVTESTDVVVEADTAEEANEKALEIAGRYGENLGNWETDEGNQAEVYLPDPESTEPV